MLSCYYPAIRSKGQDTKFTVFFIHSYVQLRISQPGLYWLEWNFAIQPDLGQVFSHFGGIVPGTAEFWASTRAIWRDMFLAEAHGSMMMTVAGRQHWCWVDTSCWNRFIGSTIHHRWPSCYDHWIPSVQPAFLHQVATSCASLAQ